MAAIASVGNVYKVESNESTFVAKERLDALEKEKPPKKTSREAKKNKLEPTRKDYFEKDEAVRGEGENYAKEIRDKIIDKELPDYIRREEDLSRKSEKPNKKEADRSTGVKKLTEGEKRQIEELKRIDAAVKAHEAAHRAAAGGLVRGGTTFEYVVGPDGKRYAVAGEVKIDMSYDMNDPEETIRKMEVVRRSALAPADPSPQDRATAARASAIEAQARAELQRRRVELMSARIKRLKGVYISYENKNQEAKTLNALASPDYSKNPELFPL